MKLQNKTTKTTSIELSKNQITIKFDLACETGRDETPTPTEEHSRLSNPTEIFYNFNLLVEKMTIEKGGIKAQIDLQQEVANDPITDIDINSTFEDCWWYELDRGEETEFSEEKAKEIYKEAYFQNLNKAERAERLVNQFAELVEEKFEEKNGFKKLREADEEMLEFELDDIFHEIWNSKILLSDYDSKLIQNATQKLLRLE